MKNVELTMPETLANIPEIATDLSARITCIWHCMCGCALMGDISSIEAITSGAVNVAEENRKECLAKLGRDGWKPKRM
jgi:hypothetical protein